MRQNKKVEATPIYTHEGAPAKRIGNLDQLRRTVLACLLWEDSFYESGESVADRIKNAIAKADDAEALGKLAIDARGKYNLRHVPLLLAREMVRKPEFRPYVRGILSEIIQRPDELTEFLAIYWKDGKTPLANSVKKGLADAFAKFNEYQLAKYNQDNSIKLKDVAFLTHPKDFGSLEKDRKAYEAPALDRKGYKRGAVVRHVDSLVTKLVNGNLSIPDTWEVALSKAKTPDEKKAIWERLMNEKKLGALAVLRNLRNMNNVGVEEWQVIQYLKNVKTERVLPYRFISAARYAPNYEPILEEVMLKNLDNEERLTGKTKLLIDVSGSMEAMLSGKSDLTRLDAASALAILLREICEVVEIITFDDTQRVCKPRRGFALRDEIGNTRGGTYLGAAVRFANQTPYDRLIVITDEQSADVVGKPRTGAKGYMINVGAYQNGVGYGDWTHIDGFSEAIVKYIQTLESEM